MARKIEIDPELIETIADWHEYGQSDPAAAIKGMREAVEALEQARKDQLGIKTLDPDVAARLTAAASDPSLLKRITEERSRKFSWELDSNWEPL